MGCEKAMEIKEAKEFLKRRIALMKCDYPEITDYMEALDVAVRVMESLNETKGMKVKDRKVLRDFKNTVYSISGSCPVCGRTDILSIKTKFCPKCGQRLDWSEAEEI